MSAPGTKWIIIHDESGHRVRRFAVPGGWLYQVELVMTHEPGTVGEPTPTTFGWTAPVFVAERT